MEKFKSVVSSFLILISLLLCSCTEEEQSLTVNEQRLELAQSECETQGWTNWGRVVDLDTTKSFGMSDSLYNQLTLTWRFNLVTLRNICTSNDTTVIAALSWCNSCPEKEQFFESITKGNLMNVYTTQFYLKYDISGEVINYDSLRSPMGW